ncbi:hypothetical protein ANO11243_022450 [Dothideomycetidae sp. 11243]|nr:hypothetical protein ANO11243_022450 [fungal sp. No.11243]
MPGHAIPAIGEMLGYWTAGMLRRTVVSGGLMSTKGRRGAPRGSMDHGVDCSMGQRVDGGRLLGFSLSLFLALLGCSLGAGLMQQFRERSASMAAACWACWVWRRLRCLRCSVRNTSAVRCQPPPVCADLPFLLALPAVLPALVSAPS